MSYKRSKGITLQRSGTLIPKPNKRAKIAAVDGIQDSAQPGVVQLTPILKLPTELLTEIPAYYPEVPARAFVDGHHTYYPQEYCARPDILRALSQTCKALRQVFLPLLWERLDVCTARFVGAWYKQVGETLEGRCQLLKRRPDLGSLVRISNVVLTRYQTEQIVPTFASCLATLPNLHTLRLIHVHSQMTTVLKTSFKECSFPQIRTIILPSHAHNILRCCPEVREVVCTEDDGSKLVSAIKASCPKVEVLDGFCPDLPMMKRIVKAAPGLRHITIHSDTTPSTIAILGTLKHLTSIDLLYVHLKQIPPWKHSQYVEATWNGSEPLTITEGAAEVKYSESVFVRAAREALRKVAAYAESDGVVKKKKKMKETTKANGGVSNGTSTRDGDNNTDRDRNEDETVNKKVQQEKSQRRLRIQHRRVTQDYIHPKVIEERFEELPI